MTGRPGVRQVTPYFAGVPLEARHSPPQRFRTRRSVSVVPPRAAMAGDLPRGGERDPDTGDRGHAALTGIPQTTISAIENGWVNLGVERAEVLAFSDRRRASAGIKGPVAIRIGQSQRRTRDR
jgi:hypothetical protein